MEALKRQRAAPRSGRCSRWRRRGPSTRRIRYDKVAVQFPLPLPEPFDYRAPASLAIEPGMHVIAPIGTRLVRGVVWAVERDHPGCANLKAIEEVLPGPPLPEISRAFLDWSAKYLVRPPGDLLAHDGALARGAAAAADAYRAGADGRLAAEADRGARARAGGSGEGAGERRRAGAARGDELPRW